LGKDLWACSGPAGTPAYSYWESKVELCHSLFTLGFQVQGSYSPWDLGLQLEEADPISQDVCASHAGGQTRE